MSKDVQEAGQGGQGPPSVHIDGDVRGDVLVAGGNITRIINVIKNPAKWPDTVFSFVTGNWAFVVSLAVLEAALAAAYFAFRGLYLIPAWYWLIGVAVLVAAASFAYAWGWGEKRRARWLALALGCALILAGMTGWQAYRIAYPPTFDTQVFGIAVAELGEGAAYRRTPQAREITGQVYEHLCDVVASEFGEGAAQADCAATGGVAVRRVGVIGDSETARAFGQRIGADVVIWGQLLTVTEGTVTIRFEVLETTDRAVNPEYPLVLPVTTTEVRISEQDLPGDPRQVKEAIADQLTVLSSFTLGLAAYLDRDFSRANRQFERATEVAGSIEDATDEQGQALLYYYLGKSYHSMGEIEDGQERLATAGEKNPDEPAIPLSLALGYNSLGLTDDADQQLETALDLLDDYLRTHPGDKEALYDRGVIHQIQGEYDFAAEDFAGAIEAEPEFYAAYISAGQVNMARGEAALAVENLEAAIALTEQTGGDPAWAYLNLARVHEESGEPEAARAAYRSAIEHAPETEWMYYYYALFLEEQGETDAALVNFERMADVADNEGWAYGHLGDFQRRRGLLDGAVASYRRAINADRDNALVHTYLAEVYMEQGRDDEAIEQFEAGIEYGEDIAYVYASYGSALYVMGDYDGAAEMYREAGARQPGTFAFAWNLAQALEAGGQDREAIEVYRGIACPEDGQFTEENVERAQERLEALGVEADCDA